MLVEISEHIIETEEICHIYPVTISNTHYDIPYVKGNVDIELKSKVKISIELSGSEIVLKYENKNFTELIELLKQSLQNFSESLTKIILEGRRMTILKLPQIDILKLKLEFLNSDLKTLEGKEPKTISDLKC